MVDVCELIWNLKRLLRDGFPQGLPVADLEDQYQKYFDTAIQPTPDSIEPGCKNWAQVFKKSERFLEWFRLDHSKGVKGQLIRALPKPERDLKVYFTVVRYTQYISARAGAKAQDWEDISESESSEEEDEEDWASKINFSIEEIPAKKPAAPKRAVSGKVKHHRPSKVRRRSTSSTTDSDSGSDWFADSETEAMADTHEEIKPRLKLEPVHSSSASSSGARQSTPAPAPSAFSALVDMKKQELPIEKQAKANVNRVANFREDLDAKINAGLARLAQLEIIPAETFVRSPSIAAIKPQSQPPVASTTASLSIPNPNPIRNMYTVEEIRSLLNEMYQLESCKLCGVKLTMIEIRAHYQGRSHQVNLRIWLKKRRPAGLAIETLSWKAVKRQNRVEQWESDCQKILNTIISLLSMTALNWGLRHFGNGRQRRQLCGEKLKEHLELLRTLLDEGYFMSPDEFASKLQSKLTHFKNLRLVQGDVGYADLEHIKTMCMWWLPKLIRNYNSSNQNDKCDK